VFLSVVLSECFVRLCRMRTLPVMDVSQRTRSLYRLERFQRWMLDDEYDGCRDPGLSWGHDGV